MRKRGGGKEKKERGGRGEEGEGYNIESKREGEG